MPCTSRKLTAFNEDVILLESLKAFRMLALSCMQECWRSTSVGKTLRRL